MPAYGYGITNLLINVAGAGGGDAIPLVNTKSLAFDGVDDYVSAGNVIDKSKSTPFSISLWVKISATVSNNVIIGKTQDPGGTLGPAGYSLYFNNQLFFLFTLDSHFSHVMYVRDNNYWGADFINNWHHIVATYDGSGLSSGMTLYVDGYDVSFFRADVGTGDFSNTGSLRIGGQEAFGYPCNPAFFNGKIDEPCIMPIELSAPEVLDIYNGVRPSGGGTGAPWNDGTGVPKDMSSYTPDGWWRNGDNSTYQAPQILMPENTNKNKVSNYSMNFDGVDDSIETTNITELNGSTSASFSMWLKLNSTGIEGLMNQWGTGADRLIYSFIWLANGRIDIYMSGNLGFRVSSNAVISALSTGQWFNLIITYDGTQVTSTDRVKAYIDNQELTGNIGGGPTSLFSSTTDFILGTYPSGTYLEGNIDEFSIFNTTLSSENITSIYNSGTPSDLSSLNPVAYYKLGEESKFTSQWLAPNQMSQDTAFDFDGSTEYINTGSSSQDGASALTISAWFNTSYDGWQYFFGDNSIKLNIKQNYPDRVDFTFNGSIDYRSTNFTITLGTWNHVALVFDGSLVQADRLKIYLNNSLLTNDLSGTSDTTFVANNNFMLGRAGTYSLQEWNGNLSEISVFNTAKDAGDVSVLYNSGTPGDLTSLSPVNWWKLDKSATFDGTNWIIPDATITPTYTSAIVLPSTYQNPPASYTSVTRSTTTWSSDHITLSFWVKFPYGWQGAQNIMHADGFTIESFQATTIQFGHNTWYKNFTLNNAYDGAWHNFIVYIPNNATIDVIDVRVWEDGQEIIGSTVGSTPAPQITTISGWGHGTFAELSNWALFDTDLSSAGNIATLYNNGTPGDISSLNPVTWYKCDEANVDFPSPVTNYIYFTDSSGNSNTGACAYDSDAIPPDPHRPYMATTNVQAENGVSSGMTETNLVRTPISFSNVYSKFSFDFDGIDDYFTVPSFTTSGDDVTISFWFNAVNLGSGTGAFLVGDANNFVRYNVNETVYARINGVDAYVSVGPGGHVPEIPQVFGTGNWHHMAITKSGSTVTWWFDGISYITAGGGTTGGFTLNYIGADQASTQYYLNGSMDEVAIWNSVQDISTIWNGGQPADLTSLSPTAWYRMGEDAHYNAAVGVSGTTSNDLSSNVIFDSTATFLSDNIQVGDLARNTTDNTITRISAIGNDVLIFIEDDIFPIGSSSGDGYKITGPAVWTVPDKSDIDAAPATSANMSIQNLQGEAPNYSGAGVSSNMYIEDRVGNAPNSDKNALSYNMYPDDIEADVPTP